MTDVVLPDRLAGVELVRSIRTPARLEYTFTAGEATSRFLRGLARRRSSASAAPSAARSTCRRGARARPTACPPRDERRAAPRGTVTTFCVVNVPFDGQAMELPYVCALILLDGADIPFMHLIQEMPAAEVHMGMRVEAVWVPDDELGPTLESIRYFRPTGEPDADYETYKDNV